MRVAVEHGDDRRRAVGREQLVEDRGRRRRSSPCARLQRAEHEVGRGQADDVGGDPAAPRARRRRRAPRASPRPSPTSVTAGAAGAAPQPVAAGEDLRRRRSRCVGSVGDAASAWSIGRVVRRKYAEQPSGAPEPASACSSVHSRSWPKAGSQAMQRGCSSPTDGVMIDWCAPPSGASVTPDGRADQDRLRRRRTCRTTTARARG